MASRLVTRILWHAAQALIWACVGAAIFAVYSSHGADDAEGQPGHDPRACKFCQQLIRRGDFRGKAGERKLRSETKAIEEQLDPR